MNPTSKELAEKIYNTLNSREFRRAQPFEGDKAKAIKAIEKAVEASEPIPLMMYWGTCAEKEGNTAVDLPEQKAIDFFAANLKKVTDIYPAGVNLDLVFVDTHVKFNGVQWDDDYTKNLDYAFNKKCALHNVHVNVSLASNYLNFTHTDDRLGFEEFSGLEALAKNSDIPDDLASMLAPRANNFYKRTDHNSEITGRMYYELCKLEKKAMGETFKDHIFLTYNPPSINGKKHFGVPAGLPAICISSFKRGMTDKPWNVTEGQFEALMNKPSADVVLTEPPCELMNIEGKKMENNQSLAIIGGGLAGMMAAFQAVKAGAGNVTLYERGSPDSYQDGKDNSYRASLSGSATRVIRMFGQKDEAGRWNIRETVKVLSDLQKEIETHPDDYSALKGKQLFHPEASVMIVPAGKEVGLAASIDTLDEAGIKYSKLSGKDLKARYPSLYINVPDDAIAMIEEPYDAEKNPSGVAGVIDTAATLQAIQLYLKKHGADLQHNTTIKQIDDQEAGVKITTDRGDFNHDRVILAPGHWLGEVKDGNGQSMVDRAGIKYRQERVIVADIDFRALGLDIKGIPFTKGLTPANGAGVFYRQTPDGADGHVKWLAGKGSKAVEGLDKLHAPISDAEKEELLNTASARFNIPVDKLKAHTQWSTCCYTYPAQKEQVLVAPISEHVVFSGLDSSGSARIAGGIGAIAAHLSLGLEEPVKGANAAVSLQAHYDIVNNGTTLDCGKCEIKNTCVKPEKVAAGRG